MTAGPPGPVTSVSTGRTAQRRPLHRVELEELAVVLAELILGDTASISEARRLCLMAYSVIDLDHGHPTTVGQPVDRAKPSAGVGS